ncbi:MAG TPA: cytochrome P460 family protein [Acidobacteriaceae bacterium]|jgi:hypothetical protein|nr:cytochrome P460 family protein [Acidobacteriaceae bacterium]
MTTRGSAVRLNFLRRGTSTLLLLAVLTLDIVYGAESVQFPEGFRRWVHVGTGVILPVSPLPESEQGMHHIFANAKGVDGYATGDFADGSMIVYELREAQQKNGIIFEGDRRRVDVMIKDSRLYASTGGWRFERFMGSDQKQNIVEDTGTSCFQCHTNAKAHGFVFSQLH